MDPVLPPSLRLHPVEATSLFGAMPWGTWDIPVGLVDLAEDLQETGARLEQQLEAGGISQSQFYTTGPLHNSTKPWCPYPSPVVVGWDCNAVTG